LNHIPRDPGNHGSSYMRFGLERHDMRGSMDHHQPKHYDDKINNACFGGQWQSIHGCGKESKDSRLKKWIVSNAEVSKMTLCSSVAVSQILVDGI
jgi:hypothetical protein